MSAVELAELLLVKLLEVLGPALARKRIDEWEAARIPSEVAFAAKFPGEGPL